MRTPWDDRVTPARVTYHLIWITLITSAIAIALGTSTPASSPAVGPLGPGNTAESRELAEPPAYDRAEFGRAWADVDRNGCDTRNDVLQRDLADVVLAADGCTVLSGTLVDPYTGVLVEFVRGRGTSSLVPVDHVYALSDAWRDGAWAWLPETRLEFANDPDNLVATTRSANSAKSDHGPARWLPITERCTYLQTYALIGVDWQFDVDQEDSDALARGLDGCDLR